MAIWVLASASAVALMSFANGYWANLAQDAQARSFDAVAATNEGNLQRIYTATVYPSPGPSPVASPSISDFGKASPHDVFKPHQLSYLPRTDIKGWADRRDHYWQLTTLAELAIFLFTLAIAVFTSAAAIKADFVKWLIRGGGVAFALGTAVFLLAIGIAVLG